jgi:endoglycosylceramidase
VFTPADEVCPPGTSPQKGWDGAPAWATFTDSAPTCSPAGREDSPAVRAAWDAFYADRNGIRRELAELWGRIATEYARVPGVAGYDLLNEPGFGNDGGEVTIGGQTAFYRESLDAIRSAERAAGAEPHLVLFETGVTGQLVTRFTDDPDMVFAPHVYAEAIGPSFPGLLDTLFSALRLLATGYGTPVWVGEYNQYGSEENQRSWMSRFAGLADLHGYAGGTWYTWNYGCGDPHGLQWPATPEWLDQQTGTCPGSRSPVACDSRSYPRAAPGRVAAIEASPCGGRLTVTGSTPSPSTADLWYRPDPALPGGGPGPPPTVSGQGVGSVTANPVGDGWRIFVGVTGDYRVEVTPAG